MEKKLFDLSDEAGAENTAAQNESEIAASAEEKAEEAPRPEAQSTQQTPFFAPQDARAAGNGYFYDPYRAEQAPQAQSAPVYTPPGASVYTPPMNSAPVKTPKKKNRVLSVFLAVALFLVGIGAGIGIYDVLKDYLPTLFSSGIPAYPDDVPSQDKTEDKKPVSGEVPDVSGGTFAPTYGDGEEVFTPAEIYANCVGGVVGVSTEITTQNVFGQQSAYATSGTGFFFSADGYILTNCHVVEKATTITVTTHDGKEYPAGLVGKDSQNDVAVLKIDPEGEVTALTMGKSADMVVGEEILIIGNPLGELTYTLTRGIVSNLSRDIFVEENETSIHMFQTDAAINSGNSGGPAIDASGNVIGIVSAKFTSSSIEGLGFCIPIDDALEIARDLVEYGYVRGRAQLGIEGQSVSGYTSGSTYLAGVRVTAVAEDSCAEKAGIRPGDIITSIGEEKTATLSNLKNVLAKYSAGDEAVLTVYRNRENILVTVILDEAK